MISPIWHGWTTPENADAYEDLPEERNLSQYPGKECIRISRHRTLSAAGGRRTELVTIMWFDSIGAVTEFAGERYEDAVVPPNARALLKRFDGSSRHYELRARRAVGD